MLEILSKLKGCNYEEGTRLLGAYKVVSMDTRMYSSVVKIKVRGHILFYVSNIRTNTQVFHKGSTLWMGVYNNRLVTSDFVSDYKINVSKLKPRRSRLQTASGNVMMYMGNDSMINIATKEEFELSSVYDYHLNVKRSLWGELYKYHIIKEMT